MVLTVQGNLLTHNHPLDDRVILPDHPEWAYWCRVARHSSMLAADTETMPKDYAKGMSDAALNPWLNAPRLLQIGVVNPQLSHADQIKPENVKCLMVDFLNSPQSAIDQLMAIAKAAVISPTRMVILHNGMADLLWWLSWWGWQSQSIFDTFIASNVLWAGIPVRHRLLDTCQRVFIPMTKEDKEFQNSDWTAPQLSNAQLNYAGNDVCVLFRAAHQLQRFVTAAGMERVHTIEQNFLPAMVQMEFDGLPVNLPKVKTIREQYQIAYDNYFADLQAEYNKCIFETSRRKKKDELFAIAQNSEPLSVDNKDQVSRFCKWLTGKKPENVDKEYLQSQAEAYPVLVNLSMCRTLKKTLDKCDAIIKGVRQHPTNQTVISGYYRQFSKSDEDGQAGAGTGRLSSGSGSRGAYPAPNLQNIPTYSKLPKEIKALGLPSLREAFGFEEGQGTFFIHDLAAAHARIAAKLSGDELMRDIYVDDRDAHALTVTELAQWLSNPPDPLPSEADVKSAKKALESKSFTAWQELLVRIRDVGKNFFYGCLNDAGVFALLKLFNSSDLPITRPNAEKALEGYFKLYAGLRRYLDELADHANNPENWIEYPELGKFYPVKDPIFGRVVKRKVHPATKKGKPAGPKAADVYSAMWLGIEASVMKYAAIKVYEFKLAHPDYPVFLGGITHDELDGWSLIPDPNDLRNYQFAKCLHEAMDQIMGWAIAPLPPTGKPTQTKRVICHTWNDK